MVRVEGVGPKIFTFGKVVPPGIVAFMLVTRIMNEPLKFVPQASFTGTIVNTGCATTLLIPASTKIKGARKLKKLYLRITLL
jgi:hypothetical protein